MTSPTTDRRQGLVGNTPIKAPVDCATTANITLSGEQTIDGFTTSQSRVLVWNQTDHTQNGIYNSSSAAWTRADDADGNYDLVNGSMVLVTGGTTNGGYVYRVSGTNPVQPGSSAINFVLGMFSSIIAAAFIASGTGAVTRSAQDKLRDEVSVKDFGAVGDGVSRQLSAVTSLGNLSTAGWTLAQWRVLFPHATALTNQLDWVAAQAAVNTGKAVKWPDGSYVHDQLLTSSTYNQRLYGNGRLATITFNLAASGAGILLSGSSGRQQVFGLNLVGSTNCTKVIDYTSPQIQVMFNWITAAPAGSIAIYGEDENVGAGKYSFGAQIGYNFIHGSFSVGSRGVRLGLNSQTTQIFSNVIDTFESGIAVENATDALVIEGNVLEALMSTGYAIDMRGTAGSPTYHAVTIRNNHIEDVYGGICWGGAFGSTYTSNVYEGNYYFGHGGTNYFLTVLATCGAGSANNRVCNNDVAGNLTSFFNLADAAGAASLIDTKGNTLAAGTFATGTFASSAYTVRTINTYFGGAVLTVGAFASQASNRQEFGTTTALSAFKWERGEFLESIQVGCVTGSGSPTITLALHQIIGNVDTVVATIGPVAATGTIVLPINTIPTQLAHYYLSDAGTAGGGTAFHYPYQAYFRQ